MILENFNNINTLDSLFIRLIENSKLNPINIVKYTNLTESEKGKISKNYIESLISMIVSKKKDIDYSVIESSAGNIKKLKSYNNFNEVLNMLSMLNNNNTVSGIDKAYIETARTALENLEALETEFVAAFKSNNEILILLYNNITLSLINYLSALCINFIEVIKQPDMTWKLQLNTERSENNSLLFHYNNLKKFNNLVDSGKLSKIISMSKKYDDLMGSITAFVSSPVFLSIVAIVLVLYLIREIIYYYYYTRVAVSDHLRYISSLIELNQTSLQADRSSVAMKQSQIITFLNKVADKIDIDQKVAVKDSSSELKGNKSSDEKNVKSLNNTLF
jgi:hypothetical protein